jgi:hypothetical protein
MTHQKHFFHNHCLALINCGWDLIENPIVSALPNAPRHNDDTFQPPWDLPSPSRVHLVAMTGRDGMKRSLKLGCLVLGQGLRQDYPVLSPVVPQNWRDERVCQGTTLS